MIGQKRKLGEAQEQTKPSKAKREAGASAAGIAEENVSTQKEKKSEESIEKIQPDDKKRYILYVTNVPYDAAKEDIEKHFSFLKEKIVSIRMLTDKGTGQFRGTCFIDCADKESFAAALKLHHTKILGRKIVVEPTVGGGGKGQNRMKKLNEKREKFSEARKKRMAKDQVKKKKVKASNGKSAKQ